METTRRYREIREALGIRPAQPASALNVDQRTIDNYEGARSPSGRADVVLAMQRYGEWLNIQPRLDGRIVPVLTREQFAPDVDFSVLGVSEQVTA